MRGSALANQWRVSLHNVNRMSGKIRSAIIGLGNWGKKVAAEADVAIVEPAPPEASPAETADQAAPAPTRKRRAKAKPEAEEAAAAPEPAPVPSANNDTVADSDDEPRRGWWQRTFG